MTGIVFLVADIRQVRPGDLQDVGAVLGEGARTGRPGEDPRQVEHSDARQRAIAVGELFRRTVADLDDLHQRQRGDCGGLRVLGPIFQVPHHAPGAVPGDDRLLKLESVPMCHRVAHRLAIFRHSEYAEGGGTIVREIAVEIAPAAVLGRIDAHYRVALGRNVEPRPSSCNARCEARQSPGGYRPRHPADARCATPTDRRRRGRLPQARRHWSRRCGMASAISDRYRR